MQKNINWQIKQEGKVKDVFDVLLKNRGINTKQEMQEFLDPKDPRDFLITDYGVEKKQLKIAIDRIKIANENNDSVVVYGDYDADGICATAILWERIFSLGIDVMPFIPNRFTHGYGLAVKSIDEILEINPKVNLIITVDNGIVAHEALEYAKQKNIDVIVTDHHERDQKEPQALAVIHTTQTSGSGISFLFSQEIGREIKSSNLLAYGDGLELSAIGTVSDQLPLLNLNRSIVLHGIKDLQKTKRIGIDAICEAAAIEKSKIGTYEINYVIAPRINAMGRLSDGVESLRLICATKKDKAQVLSKLVTETNIQRQNMVLKTVEMARNVGDLERDKIIVLGSSEFHEGVVGLAASNLVEEFFRPAIVFSFSEGIAKASARSINGFNIIEAVRNFSSYLIAGGGHPMAAGFSIKLDDFDEFREKIINFANEQIIEDDLVRKIKADCVIKLSDCNPQLYQEIQYFEPTGMGNPKPSFVSKKVKVVDLKKMGENQKHLKLQVSDKTNTILLLIFNKDRFMIEPEKGDILDILYNISSNTWMGKTEIQLIAKDIKKNVSRD